MSATNITLLEDLEVGPFVVRAGRQVDVSEAWARDMVDKHQTVCPADRASELALVPPDCSSVLGVEDGEGKISLSDLSAIRSLVSRFLSPQRGAVQDDAAGPVVADASGKLTGPGGPIAVSGALKPAVVMMLGLLVGATGAVYFVDAASGNDANSGLTDTAAWKSLDKVNAASLNPGDAVLFAAGQTYNGATLIPKSGSKGHPIVYGSFGAGRATIQTTAEGVNGAQQQSYFTVRDLNLVGPGATHASKVDGVYLDAGGGATGPVMLPGVSLINIDIALYPSTGSLMTNTSASWVCGYTDWLMSGVVAHDCSGNARDFGFGGGIGVGVTGAWVGYGLKSNIPSFTRGRVTRCTAYNCSGTAGVPNSGNGIQVTNVKAVTVDYNYATNCGANSSGSGGIWMCDAIGCVMRYCEVAAMKSAGPLDGAGFDIDGGCVGCVIEYCYAHDCDAGGFYIYNFSEPTLNAPSFNTLRYCISVNNGKNPSTNTHSQYLLGNDGTAGSNWLVYNNIAVTNVAGSSCLAFAGSSIGATTITVANNVFLTASTSQKLIDCVGSVTPTNAVIVNNNYWSGSAGAGTIQWGANSYTSIAAWQTASGQEKISGTSKYLNVDPGYVAPFSPTSPGPDGLASLIAQYGLKGSSGLAAKGLNLTTQYGFSTGGLDFCGGPSPMRGSVPCVGAIEG